MSIAVPAPVCQRRVVRVPSFQSSEAIIARACAISTCVNVAKSFVRDT